jgi:hypothetical protein
MMTHLEKFRSFLPAAWRAAVFCGAALCVLPAWAQTKVVLVEEHWELEVAEPDAGRSAPQTSMVMSPTEDSEDLFFMFTINHHDASGYQPGGMQVQLWDDEDLVDDRTAYENGTLNNSGEVVTWVQRLELDDGQLTFGIHNGTSQTWGSFGGDDMTLSTPSTLTGLNAYLPAVSLTESQVGYAENRVTSLVLKKLMWVTDDGQVFELSAPIPIDTSLDP